MSSRCSRYRCCIKYIRTMLAALLPTHNSRPTVYDDPWNTSEPVRAEKCSLFMRLRTIFHLLSLFSLFSIHVSKKRHIIARGSRKNQTPSSVHLNECEHERVTQHSDSLSRLNLCQIKSTKTSAIKNSKLTETFSYTASLLCSKFSHYMLFSFHKAAHAHTCLDEIDNMNSFVRKCADELLTHARAHKTRSCANWSNYPVNNSQLKFYANNFSANTRERFPTASKWKISNHCSRFVCGGCSTSDDNETDSVHLNAFTIVCFRPLFDVIARPCFLRGNEQSESHHNVFLPSFKD